MKALNEQARILYDSFYSFNEGESSCSFDESGYQTSFDEMCGIIQKIVSKLQTINNGDFVVEDYITKAPND